MERMFSEAFLVIIERWVVIPIDSWFIANGLFVHQASNPQYIKAADNILGVLFFFLFSWVVHTKSIKPLDNPDAQSVLSKLWNWFSGFAFKPKTIETAKVEEQPVSQ